MALNQFTWNNGSKLAPVVLTEQRLAGLLAAKTAFPSTSFDIKGYADTESGAIAQHRKQQLAADFSGLNVVSVPSQCIIHQDDDINSHNVYNEDEVPIGDEAIAQNTTILKTNSDIGRQGLTMTTSASDTDFTYGFKPEYIDPASPKFNAVTWIRANSHRYIGKYVDGVMRLRQLSDTDGTMYADGGSAVEDLVNPAYDSFVKLPAFWFRTYVEVTNGVKNWDKVYVCFTVTEPEDANVWEYWDGRSCIGTYKGYLIDTDGTKTLHSVSGVEPTRSVSYTNFKAYARNRGSRFRLVTYQAHKVMALLFYAFYGDLNCQNQCGSGTNTVVSINGSEKYTAKITGLTNRLGMMDTVNTRTNSLTALRWFDYSAAKDNYGNGTSAFLEDGTPDYENGNFVSINFWGLENWWGDIYEWMDDIYGRTSAWLKTYIQANGSITLTADGKDTIVTIGNMNEVLVDETGYLWYTILNYDGSVQRVIKTLAESGYIDRMMFGEHNDLFATKVESSMTHFDDYFTGSGGSGYVGRRSRHSAGSVGGVGYLGLSYAAGYAYSNVGSRLLYDGDSEIVASFD